MSNLEKMPPDVLAWLQERVVEHDGCWVWNGACFHGNDPRAHRDGKTVAVRRLLYNATHIRQLRSNECAVKLPECHARCAHPDHVRGIARSSIQKGRKHSREHTIAIALARRANAKIDTAAVVDIRTSTEPISVLAQRYGIDDSYVSQIRLHQSWKDYASPFAGLLAANDAAGT